MVKLVTFLCSVILLGSCQLSKDPNQTLKNIQRSHILRVGVCASSNNQEQVYDLKLLEKLSSDLKAELVQMNGVEDTLLRKLENHTLDLVICGIQEDNPWNPRVAFTTPLINPIQHEKYVWAVPQGENAWLKYVDEFIKASGPAFQTLP